MNTADTSADIETIDLTWSPPPADENEIPTVILEWYPLATVRKNVALETVLLPR